MKPKQISTPQCCICESPIAFSVDGGYLCLKCINEAVNVIKSFKTNDIFLPEIYTQVEGKGGNYEMRTVRQ